MPNIEILYRSNKIDFNSQNYIIIRKLMTLSPKIKFENLYWTQTKYLVEPDADESKIFSDFENENCNEQHKLTEEK